MPNNLDMGGFANVGAPVLASVTGAVRLASASPGTALEVSTTNTVGLAQDWRVNGFTKASVGKAGNIFSSAGGIKAAADSVTTDVFSGYWGPSLQVMRVNINQGVPQITVDSNGSYSFNSSILTVTTPDVILYRHAAGVLIQRNGTNAQQSILSRSWTDNSNYSWYRTAWNASTLLMMAEGAGTGTDGSVAFNDAVLATTATVGFVMLPSCAGTPTGVPNDIPTGQCPAVIDSSANRIWIYVGGAWKYAALT